MKPEFETSAEEELSQLVEGARSHSRRMDVSGQPHIPNQRLKPEFETSATEEQSQLVEGARPHRQRMDASGQPHIPNYIPEGTRMWNICLSCLLIIWGTVGVSLGGILVPGKRIVIIIHGIPMWFVFAAILMAVANLLSVVLDHYDRRDNENLYKQCAKFTQCAAWTFFVIAFILDFLVFGEITRL